MKDTLEFLQAMLFGLVFSFLTIAASALGAIYIGYLVWVFIR
jgi:hypothetical protein